MKILETLLSCYYGKDYQSNKEKIHEQIKKRVNLVAQVIFWGGTIPVMMYVTSLTFAVSVFMGMSDSKKIDKTVDKIILLWTTHPIIMGAGTAVFFGIGSDVVVVHGIAFVLGARLGKMMREWIDNDKKSFEDNGKHQPQGMTT